MSSEKNSYRLPMTIAYAIDQVKQGNYVLPGIQRKFVWTTEQIECLFDSIMQDYPINTLMLWHISDGKEGESLRIDYPFYSFITNYKERYKTENEAVSVIGTNPLYAVIDGQQRLTSLHIGLNGTYAAHRKYRGWEDTPENFPKLRLYLDLLGQPDTDSDYGYPFKFMTKDKAITDQENNHWWYPVGQILRAKDPKYVSRYLIDNKLTNYDVAFDRMELLRDRLLKDERVSFYVQEDQDQDKVLEIFTRTNSGGVPLTKSDLIMAIASSNWEDMRDNVEQLVTQINTNTGFHIDKDLVLRTFLVCYGKDVKFKVENFGKSQVDILAQHWTTLSLAISNTFTFLQRQGFDDRTLRARNAVIPIVQYFIQTNQFADIDKTTFGQISTAQQPVVEDILKWLNISLLKGIFGGQTDNLLSGLRDVIRKSSTPTHFPLKEIRVRFKGSRKDYSLGQEAIEGLLESEYGTHEATYILHLLHGRLDPALHYEQDHLHPASFFKEDESLPKKEREAALQKKLSEVFSDPEDIDFAMDPRNWNSVLNLQLLEKRENIDKTLTPLDTWAKGHGLNGSFFLVPPDTDLSIRNFHGFINMRRAELTKRLTALLMD